MRKSITPKLVADTSRILQISLVSRPSTSRSMNAIRCRSGAASRQPERARRSRRYATQMRQLGDMARGIFRGRSEDPETLARLQNQILEQTGVNKAKDRS